MKIVGSSKQEGTPKPDNPVQITNETVLIITDKEGNKKEMPFKYEKILKEGDKIEKINGEWCLVRRKPMNDIEIIKQVIYTKQGEKMSYIDIDNIIDNECENFIQAIENLIQRNKDLEQIEQEHKEENGRLREEIDKKDKIINDMANLIEKDDIAIEEFICPYCKYQLNKECTEKECIEQIINYFTNKAEESD